VSEFLRFGNTVVAVDKIVSVSFQPGDDADGATLVMHFGSRRDDMQIECQGEIAKKIWAYWVRKTENNAGSQEQLS
jgi:hypothetical protein